MKKVLLVEDNEMNRDMLMRRLVKKGYSVEFAVDGEEALEKSASVHPDIILMDMSLPKLDGLEATRRIRADDALKKIPIIVLTANATVADRETAIAAGCDEFETKPIQLPTLLEKMEACLGAT
jgi:CheY-like chemotaxis protein